MVKYSIRDEDLPEKVAKARASSLRVHFKKCREVGAAVKGLSLTRAKAYLNDVLNKKAGVPFRRFTGGCGRHAQGKNENAPGNCIGWPVNATKAFLDLLQNAESNAVVNGLDPESLYVSHVQVNQAPKMRRRTYRAHGRINAYMSCPSHIELILTEKATPVERAPEAAAPTKPLSAKRRAQLRLRSGASAATA